MPVQVIVPKAAIMRFEVGEPRNDEAAWAYGECYDGRFMVPFSCQTGKPAADAIAAALAVGPMPVMNLTGTVKCRRNREGIATGEEALHIVAAEPVSAAAEVTASTNGRAKASRVTS